MKLAVLGTGAMGTACAVILAQRTDLEVHLWARREEHARQMNLLRVNHPYLPEVPLPNALRITADEAEALSGADAVFAATPVVHLRSCLGPLAPWVPAGAPVVSVAKGLERETFLRPSQIIQEMWGPRPVVALGGPSHAEELVRGQPTLMVAASDDVETAIRVQEWMSRERLRVYTNDDLVGAELAGALKNVIAIAAGCCDGLSLGDNAKSALVTRGLVELIRYCTYFGGRRETLYGLAGVGDLFTTCVSPFGRNRAVGLQLGQGKSLKEILAATSTVAEGVWTAKAIRDQAEGLGVEMPICCEVYRVLYEGKPVPDAVRDLMLRAPRGEWTPS